MTTILQGAPKDSLKTLHFVRLPNLPILEQLQLEEALLRTETRNWCLVNSGSPPAIVMGISGKPDLLINKTLLSTQPVPVIRRFSGGGTVYIDPQTIFVTWIYQTEDSGVPCCPQKIHSWSIDIFQKAFPSLKLDLRENDYVIGHQKCGGNAQYLCKRRWLHHTSFLWDYCPNNMQYLLMPPKAPNYRQNRSHGEFLCRLKDQMAEPLTFEQDLKQMLEKEYDLREIAFQDMQEILNRPHRKATELLSL